MRNQNPYLIALGLLYYPLQQLIFYVRFGRFNATFHPMDLLLEVVGVLAFLMLSYTLSTTKQSSARTLLWVLFLLVAVPLSLIGSVGGGLLGPLGIVVFGLVPVLLVLLLAKGVIRVFWKK